MVFGVTDGFLVVVGSGFDVVVGSGIGVVVRFGVGVVLFGTGVVLFCVGVVLFGGLLEVAEANGSDDKDELPVAAGIESEPPSDPLALVVLGGERVSEDPDGWLMPVANEADADTVPVPASLADPVPVGTR